MTQLMVRNPVALSIHSHVDPAPRVRDLDGKRIALYWNIKAGGEVALQATEKLLRQRYPRAQFAYYRGDVGNMVRHLTASEADRIARESDVAIGTSAD